MAVVVRAAGSADSTLIAGFIRALAEYEELDHEMKLSS